MWAAGYAFCKFLTFLFFSFFLLHFLLYRSKVNPSGRTNTVVSLKRNQRRSHVSEGGHDVSARWNFNSPISLVIEDARVECCSDEKNQMPPCAPTLPHYENMCAHGFTCCCTQVKLPIPACPQCIYDVFVCPFSFIAINTCMLVCVCACVCVVELTLGCAGARCWPYIVCFI